MVQFDDDQWVAARDRARLEGLSLAAFVRRAVDERLAHAESARGAIVRRALAAIDGRSDVGPAPRADGEDVCPGAGPGVPRYWLDDPLDEPSDNPVDDSLDAPRDNPVDDPLDHPLGHAGP